MIRCATSPARSGWKWCRRLQPRAGEDPDAARMKKLIELCQRGERPRHLRRAEHDGPQVGADAARRAPRQGNPDAAIVEIDIMEAVPKSELSAGLLRAQDAAEHRDPGESPEMTQPLVSIRDLHVELGGAAILQGINANLVRGQITAVIGHNGSGKTTLLRAILKEIPYRGKIEFHCGHDHSPSGARSRRLRTPEAPDGRPTAADGPRPDGAGAAKATDLLRHPSQNQNTNASSCSTGSRPATFSTGRSMAFPAANCSASCWHWRCSPSPSCCYLTSRPPASTSTMKKNSTS